MKDETVLAVLGVLERFLLVVAGLLLGVIFADLASNEDDWLYRWSTLIAGVLALIAGVMTFVAALVVDRKQGKRHNELMALNVRADRLKVARIKGFSDLFDQIAEEASGLREWVASKAANHSELRKKSSLLLGSFHTIETWGEMEKSQPLFGAELNGAYQFFTTEKRDYQEFLGAVDRHGAIEFKPKTLEILLRDIGESAKQIAREIEALAKEYNA